MAYSHSSSDDLVNALTRRKTGLGARITSLPGPKPSHSDSSPAQLLTNTSFSAVPQFQDPYLLDELQRPLLGLFTVTADPAIMRRAGTACGKFVALEEAVDALVPVPAPIQGAGARHAAYLRRLRALVSYVDRSEEFSEKMPAVSEMLKSAIDEYSQEGDRDKDIVINGSAIVGGHSKTNSGIKAAQYSAVLRSIVRYLERVDMGSAAAAAAAAARNASLQEALVDKKVIDSSRDTRESPASPPGAETEPFSPGSQDDVLAGSSSPMDSGDEKHHQRSRGDSRSRSPSRTHHRRSFHHQNSGPGRGGRGGVHVSRQGRKRICLNCKHYGCPDSSRCNEVCWYCRGDEDRIQWSINYGTKKLKNQQQQQQQRGRVHAYHHYHRNRPRSSSPDNKSRSPGTRDRVW
ncbi:uncharacterized protein SAPINGB_P005164 [Magnusiomyces paraingens]|uniref:Uncharacterized protein n=1 Tax=Magnusiomyces paraingens TaxID=2606893 RepID=A0A5E8C5U6_9ASCO|nr:uncharacterized protein SAPINGB_P005164 [Saprochaete ingens]VVT56586.1 unnamed protein product [Saprochaete ingens]